MNDEKDLKDKGIVFELASAACDGPLSDEDQSKLDELLRSDEAARQTWLSFSRLHTEMCLHSRSVRILNKSLDSVRDSTSVSPDDCEAGEAPASEGRCALPEAMDDLIRAEEQTELHPSASQSGRRSGAAWLIAAWATLAASLLLSWSVWDRSLRDRPNDDSGVDSELVVSKGAGQRLHGMDDPVAKIIRKIDCDWEGERWRVNSSSNLYRGETLSLVRGLMELEFASGARVTLEAPSTFTLESHNHAVLSHGKLTAHVPESARGFTVATPRGDVIDLGTDFGLLVTEQGDAETHVFNGEVIVREKEGQDRHRELSLTDEMAVSFSGDPARSGTIDLAPARFARLEFDLDRQVASPAIDRGLTLWYSAEGRIQLDEQNRVVAWGDLQTESNSEIHDAWQVEPADRPLWVENGVGGLPAIRFSGRQSLITEPVLLGSSMTAVAVFRVNEQLFHEIGPKDTSGLQVLNTNAYPRLVFGVTHQMGMFSRMRTGARKDPSGLEIPLDASQLESQHGSAASRAVVAMSVYRSEENRSWIYLNGRLVSEAEAPMQGSTLSTRYIGSHYSPEEIKFFFGDIAELMVFDAGLTEEECSLLNESLAEKYGLSSANQD